MNGHCCKKRNVKKKKEEEETCSEDTEEQRVGTNDLDFIMFLYISTI